MFYKQHHTAWPLQKIYSKRVVRGGTLPHTVIFKNFFAAIETTKSVETRVFISAVAQPACHFDYSRRGLFVLNTSNFGSVKMHCFSR